MFDRYLVERAGFGAVAFKYKGSIRVGNEYCGIAWCGVSGRFSIPARDLGCFMKDAPCGPDTNVRVDGCFRQSPELNGIVLLILSIRIARSSFGKLVCSWKLDGITTLQPVGPFFSCVPSPSSCDILPRCDIIDSNNSFQQSLERCCVQRGVDC